MGPMTEAAAALLYALAWTAARLPWPVLRALADAMAWLSRASNGREARVARRNLELVRPDLAPAAREALLRAILRTTSRQAFETLRLWTRPAARNLADITEVHGEALFDAALADGRGLIVAAPHMGNWELLNQWLASRGPVSIVYAPPDSAVGDAFLQRARGGENITQIPAEGPAVRQMLKTLKAGGTVGILPDQQPKQGDGVFVPFFGIDALTMTLVNRLAERTGATVLYGWCERIGPDMQFALHVEPASPHITDPDPQVAATTLNAGIERIARRDPTQYQCTYKRYTLRPPESGETDPYATERHPH